MDHSAPKREERCGIDNSSYSQSLSRSVREVTVRPLMYRSIAAEELYTRNVNAEETTSLVRASRRSLQSACDRARKR